MLAEEWGRRLGACTQEMAWRKTLGDATQTEAWRRCQRADWMLRELRHGLSYEEQAVVLPGCARAVARSVERAVRDYALHGDIHADEQRSPPWESRWPWMPEQVGVVWTRLIDRTLRVAFAKQMFAEAGAWEVASHDAAERGTEEQMAAIAAGVRAHGEELRLQADDLRHEIPVWPGT